MTNVEWQMTKWVFLIQKYEWRMTNDKWQMANDENDKKRHKRDIFDRGHFCWRHRGNRTWPVGHCQRDIFVVTRLCLCLCLCLVAHVYQPLTDPIQSASYRWLILVHFLPRRFSWNRLFSPCSQNEENIWARLKTTRANTGHAVLQKTRKPPKMRKRYGPTDGRTDKQTLL